MLPGRRSHFADDKKAEFYFSLLIFMGEAARAPHLITGGIK